MKRSFLLASAASLLATAHISLHQDMIARCPGLSPAKPTDVQFSMACVHNVRYVPEAQRAAVLAAFDRGIASLKGKDSEGADIIRQNLTTAKHLLAKVDYPKIASQSAGNGQARTHDLAASVNGESPQPSA